MSSASPTTPQAIALSRREQQLRDLRFRETLQATLAGSRDTQALYSSVVHRFSAAYEVDGACVAAFEPISGSLDIVHQAGAKHTWNERALRQAVEEQRTVVAGETLTTPIISRAVPSGGAPRIWGVLATVRLPIDGEPGPSYTYSERQTLRAAADCVAVELERRRISLLDDVTDGLLRKTKPIDVYTHSLRELRRFIRYDHSASVMTMQRGMAQLTVRVEKVVRTRGKAETLVDSSRRGRVLRLTANQAQYLGNLDRPIELTRTESKWVLIGADNEPEVAGLWHVLGAENGSGEGSVLCYPLIFGGQMLGILRLAAKRPEAFDPLEQYERLLERFARLLSVTLYRSELYHQSDRQLQAIKGIGRAITEPIPVKDICEQVLQLALRVLHVQVGAVGLLTPENTLELVAHQGCTLATPPLLRVGEGISGRVVQKGTSQVVPNVHQEPAYVVYNSRVCSELVSPIAYNREVIGFLDVESFEEGRFREEDEEVITFLEALANQAAIAIKTSQLHTEAVKRLGGSMAIDPNLSMAGLQDLLLQELRDKIEQLHSANDRLEAANRAKSEFLAHVSHDLRGPLNVIVGLANLLTDPSVSTTLGADKQREMLETIRSSGEVLGSLIGNILDLSALEAGKVQLQIAPFDASAAFGYLVAMARTLAEENLSEVNITLNIDPAITTISADEDRFLRIMINLISNAVKFTPCGGRIDIRAHADPECGGLHIVVADTGIGIPHEELEHVFQPFRQVEGTSGQRHGTGLGLAVVGQLVTLHGGKVWVESILGEGSAFHVLLPHALSNIDQEMRVPHLLLDPEMHDPIVTSPPSSRGLVLVVEDTEAHMNVMRLAVTSRGYTMHGVTSGEEALLWLADHRPDVILLDLQLPGVDGFTVAAEIRGRLETHNIPIIAVTADALTINEQRARASGCDAYLTKPVDIGSLLTTIETVSL